MGSAAEGAGPAAKLLTIAGRAGPDAPVLSVPLMNILNGGRTQQRSGTRGLHALTGAVGHLLSTLARHDGTRTHVQGPEISRA